MYIKEKRAAVKYVPKLVIFYTQRKKHEQFPSFLVLFPALFG